MPRVSKFMTRSELIRASLSLVLAAVAVSAGFPQSPAQSRPAGKIENEAERLYVGAHPYIDEPLPELKRRVHELGGLKPALSQKELSALLVQIGAEADELLQKVPDLISDEAVSESQYSLPQGSVSDCASCNTVGASSASDRTFNYLMLTQRAQNGRLILQEYRTARNGKPISQGAGTPNFQGFISAWIVFSSLNQAESRFRYLGEQTTDRHPTFVVGFAQIPGLVEAPGQILTGRESVPMLLQGIAWIDQSDFRIVRLRTDLLAPQPEIRVEKQTANILFGPVHIVELATELWLPKAVNLEMETRGQSFHEEHKYSRYRLYRSKSRIILSPQ
jgi:hypothetical protein